MGILQNDTNTVFVDSVLTDFGRQALARNDGSFAIQKWAASDDEIDYSIIQKYGRTEGVEKIEANTPVLEALTNGSLAQTYLLVSLSNPFLTRMPNLSLTGEGVSNGTLVSIGNTTLKRRTLTVSQTLAEGTTIDVELRDQSFIVQLDNRFLQILNSGSPDNVDSQQRATYILTRDASETSVGGSRLTIQLATKAILESQFQTYGTQTNKNIINTFVRVSGTNSGSVIEFQTQISKVQ